MQMRELFAFLEEYLYPFENRAIQDPGVVGSAIQYSVREFYPVFSDIDEFVDMIGKVFYRIKVTSR